MRVFCVFDCLGYFANVVVVFGLDELGVDEGVFDVFVCDSLPLFLVCTSQVVQLFEPEDALVVPWKSVEHRH